ncbi:membrane protein [Lactococcus hodotermopsidis]|uniref:Membrane protein n=1 Tax=Pseudolactococcus hodotermopsidis TaxID=2709157 RepID=A0A6A0BB27_9LACT|nr:DUF1622 domain-containing protein [Lactococcus hodotermopsidis]GFH42026.1 membrane protein [Lactococcus hodotermopsidis]
MVIITKICDVLIVATSVVAVIVLLCGVVKATVKFAQNELTHSDKLRAIKNELGAYVLLSLEILIAADIIESIIKPTFADIGKLAALVVIRTVISYFLGKEIDQEK